MSCSSLLLVPYLWGLLTFISSFHIFSLPLFLPWRQLGWGRRRGKGCGGGRMGGGGDERGMYRGKGKEKITRAKLPTTWTTDEKSIILACLVYMYNHTDVHFFSGRSKQRVRQETLRLAALRTKRKAGSSLSLSLHWLTKTQHFYSLNGLVYTAIWVF